MLHIINCIATDPLRYNFRKDIQIIESNLINRIEQTFFVVPKNSTAIPAFTYLNHLKQDLLFSSIGTTVPVNV